MYVVAIKEITTEDGQVGLVISEPAPVGEATEEMIAEALRDSEYDLGVVFVTLVPLVELSAWVEAGQALIAHPQATTLITASGGAVRRDASVEMDN